MPASSVELLPIKETVNGASPLVTSALAIATGAWLALFSSTVIVKDVVPINPSASVTINVTTFSPTLLKIYSGSASVEVIPSPKSQS